MITFGAYGCLSDSGFQNQPQTPIALFEAMSD